MSVGTDGYDSPSRLSTLIGLLGSEFVLIKLVSTKNYKNYMQNTQYVTAQVL